MWLTAAGRAALRDDGDVHFGGSLAQVSFFLGIFGYFDLGFADVFYSDCGRAVDVAVFAAEVDVPETLYSYLASWPCFEP